jgi:hypothetical protein
VRGSVVDLEVFVPSFILSFSKNELGVSLYLSPVQGGDRSLCEPVGDWGEPYKTDPLVLVLWRRTDRD